MEEEIQTAVIGAGFAGLSAALYRARRGEKVIVFEQGTGKESASFASTAEMNHDPDVVWDDVINRFGIEGAKKIWVLTEHAMEHLSNFAGTSGAPRFETKRLPAHLFAYEHKDTEHIERKYELYRLLGARVKRNEGLHPSFARSLTIEDEGRTNNQGLLKALTHSFRISGGDIKRKTSIVEIDGSGPYTLISSDGEKIKAQEVHVATGDGAGFIQSVSVERMRTFVVRYKSSELPKFYRQSLMWDVHEPFHYIRTFRGSELWVGGEDMPEALMTQDSELRAYQELDRFTRNVLNIPTQVLQVGSWSGTFFPATRSLPYIGTDARGIAVSVGFGGSGLLMSYISGYLHDAWKQGKEQEYRELFSLSW